MRTAEAGRILTPRPVRASVDEMVSGATVREPLGKPADSLSGSRFERVVIGGDRYVLKHLHVDDDWIQRALGDLIPRPLVLWRSGLFDALPDCLDHTIVDVAVGPGRNGWGAAVLMRDVSDSFLPDGEAPIPLGHQLRFLEHMAQLHAAFWGFEDGIGLMPIANRLFMLSPLMARLEAARGEPDPVPRLVPDGWRRIEEEAPRAAAVVLPLLADPSPLVEALERTPMTLIHSDWKAGNLGSQPDGRTILVDWAFPGRAPATLDLAWYIAVNCDRLSVSKEETIEQYREALERHGVETTGWWTHQWDLALVAAFALLGWSKIDEELAWWAERVPAAARRSLT